MLEITKTLKSNYIKALWTIHGHGRRVSLWDGACAQSSQKPSARKDYDIRSYSQISEAQLFIESQTFESSTGFSMCSQDGKATTQHVLHYIEGNLYIKVLCSGSVSCDSWVFKKEGWECYEYSPHFFCTTMFIYDICKYAMKITSIPCPNSFSFNSSPVVVKLT